jgi:hypothetical protein
MYRCLRCGEDVRSTATGAHEARHKRLDALHPGAAPKPELPA